MNGRKGREVGAMRTMRGFTLVELMVALVLGMIVSAAAIAVFMSNRQVYTTTENLGRAQETVRTAYELMARNMREASGNPCEAGLPTVNVLNAPAANWWSNFDNGVRGYDGATAFPDRPFGNARGDRIAGTDALEMKSATADGVTVVSHNAPAAQFKVNTINHGIASGDVVMVCDFDHAAILQISNANPGVNDTIVHNTGVGVPGNCSKGLGFSAPPNCTVLGSPYTYGPNSIIARLRMERWYVGNDGNGGRSLFQAVLVNNAGTLSVARQEIADGVRNLRLQYLVTGATTYADAGAIAATDWGARVIAVRVVLTLAGNNGSNGADAVDRTLEHTVTLRNRVP